MTMKWILAHRGVVLSVGGPGARKDISEVDEYFAKGQGNVLVQE